MSSGLRSSRTVKDNGEDARGSLAVVGLRKVYPGPPQVMAVRDIEFSVEKGEIFGILGPNGAGKTTTVNICATRILPSQGEVRVAQVDAIARPATARRHIGLVSQANTLDRSLTVYETLYFHCLYFGLSAAAATRRTTSLLQELRLTERAHAFPRQLSAGFAKRVQLARAIAHWPQVMFLDEPTAGLDPQTRLAVHEFIRNLKRSCLSVVLSTHYLEEAETLCDRVAIIDKGAVLAIGTPGDLKRRIDNHAVFRVTLTQAGDTFRARLAQLPGVVDVDVATNCVSVLAKGREGFLPALVRALDGATVRDIAVTGPSLENVFMKLTGQGLRD